MTKFETSEDVFAKIVEVRGGTTDQLRDRHNTDPWVVRSRHLAAILLGQYWENPRDEKIATKLNSSTNFVEQAIRLAAEDVEFKADLAQLGCTGVAGSKGSELEGKSDSAGPKQILSPLQKLKLIAKVEFDYEWASLFINIHGTRTARVRRTLIIIGRDYLSMTREQLADVFDTRVSNLDQVVQRMSEDVDHDKDVHRQIAGICKRHNIEFVRKRKAA